MKQKILILRQLMCLSLCKINITLAGRTSRPLSNKSDVYTKKKKDYALKSHNVVKIEFGLFYYILRR